MRAVRVLRSWPLLCSLLCSLLALAVAPQLRAQPQPSRPAPVALAHSALITLFAAVNPDGIILQIHGNPPAPPQVTVTELKVTLDGKEVPVTAEPVTGWRVSLPAGTTAKPRQLEATVTHDGIREVLSAQLPGLTGAAAPAAKPAAGGWGIHNQLVWWIFNIAIVLIAALVISRRTS
jgi:hypothetical protein